MMEPIFWLHEFFDGVDYRNQLCFGPEGDPYNSVRIDLKVQYRAQGEQLVEVLNLMLGKVWEG